MRDEKDRLVEKCKELSEEFYNMKITKGGRKTEESEEDASPSVKRDYQI